MLLAMYAQGCVWVINAHTRAMRWFGSGDRPAKGAIRHTPGFDSLLALINP